MTDQKKDLPVDEAPKVDEAAKGEKIVGGEAANAPKKGAISKKLADGGYHNCTRYYLETKNGNISGLGKIKNKIKAMHESNIDVFNEHQHNSLLLIKKDGKKYELVDVKIPGRKRPLKMFMEIKKK